MEKLKAEVDEIVEQWFTEVFANHVGLDPAVHLHYAAAKDTLKERLQTALTKEEVANA